MALNPAVAVKHCDRCEPAIIKHSVILKKRVDRSNVPHYWNSVSSQRAGPARNGVAAGIGGNFGVSPTSVAVSIQVTNTQIETGHPAQSKGMGLVKCRIWTVFPLLMSIDCDINKV